MWPFLHLKPEPGLCATCAHCRMVESDKGSRFYLCQLGLDGRSGFRKYPRIPVVRCSGFEYEVRNADSVLNPIE